MATTTALATREPKDLRYRREFFPNAASMVFDTRTKGFVPLPILFRKLLRHLSAGELRVLTYLQLRASRYGICYPTIEDIVHELGLTSRKNLMPHIESLEEKKFIATHVAGPRRYFLLHDPRVPIRHLIEQGTIGKEELFEVNELYKDLGQDPLPVPESLKQKPTAQFVPEKDVPF